MGRYLKEYPGESYNKSKVRDEVYRRAKEMWVARGGYPGGRAVVLAGPEAQEVEALRDYFRLPPAQVLFVDRDPRGLYVAEKKWPGVGTFHGELKDALQEVDEIGFLNLDFMGKYDRNVCLSAKAARGKIKLGAVIAYTFFKGHEYEGQWGFRRQKSVIEKVLGRPTRTTDEIRFAGSAACLAEDFALATLQYRWSTSYRSMTERSIGSPMGVLLLQNSVY